jgi:uncharacterized protein (DUF433 family)
MILDAETIEKILLYKDYNNLSEEDIQNCIIEISHLNTIYRRKIEKYTKYIEKNSGSNL